MRVGGGFASEVPGLEFLEAGVDVVDVENDDRCDPLVGVDLKDLKSIGLNCLGLAAQARRSLRMRRPPRVATTVDAKFMKPTSAAARKSSISASRPCRTPPFTVRRRSSMEKLWEIISAMASQSRSA